MRILTANLFSSRADPVALVEILQRASVDVACVQELGVELATAVSSVLPHGWLAPNRQNRGLGIATRLAARTTSLELPKRDAVIALLSPAEWPTLRTPVEIVNWHVMAPHTWPYFPNRNRRSEQLRRMLEHLNSSPDIPRALLGDYNATPTWPLYKTLARRMHDAASLAPGGDPGNTWPVIPGLPGGLFRIDHCLVSGLDCAEVESILIPGSDHRGLLVDLHLPPYQAG